jgi:hypothetical protein
MSNQLMEKIKSNNTINNYKVFKLIILTLGEIQFKIPL